MYSGKVQDQLRGEQNFKIVNLRTTLKSFYISMTSVKLWNNLSGEIKQSPHTSRFIESTKVYCLTDTRDKGQF